MKVCILSGSPGENSNTIKISKAIYNKLSAIAAVEIVDFSKSDIPLSGHGNVNISQLTVFQKHLYQSMSEAELVFIISPEYNWMPSAEIINFINQMADKPFSSMWDNKVFALAGVSNGRGGKMPIVQLLTMLSKVLGFMNFNSIISPRPFESQFTQLALDEEGNSLGNTEFDKGLNFFIETAIKFNKRWSK